MSSNRNRDIFPLVFILFTIIYFLIDYKAGLYYFGPARDFYLHIIQYINSGFKEFKIINNFPSTFPMWGYGWVLAFIKNDILIQIIQVALSTFTMIEVYRFLRAYTTNNLIFSFLKFFLIAANYVWVSFSLVAVSDSIAGNFVTLSLIYLIKFFLTGRVRYIFLTNILFGLNLNFRSDFFYYPLFLFLILIVFRKKLFPKAILFLFTYILLIPYAIYTKRTDGHYHFTVTHVGAVLWTGLRILPDNPWIGPPLDTSPEKEDLLRKKLGMEYRPGIMFDCKADKVLFKEFLNDIKKYPLHFLKKLLYQFKNFHTSGIATVRVMEWGGPPPETAKTLKKVLKTVDVKKIKEIGFSNVSGIILNFFAQKISKIFFISITIFLFYNIYLFFKSNISLENVVISLAIFNWLLTFLLGTYFARYKTMIFPVYLMFIFTSLYNLYKK